MRDITVFPFLLRPQEEFHKIQNALLLLGWSNIDEKSSLVKLSSELARDRRAWIVSVHDVVNSIGNANSTYPERMATNT